MENLTSRTLSCSHCIRVGLLLVCVAAGRVAAQTVLVTNLSDVPTFTAVGYAGRDGANPQLTAGSFTTGSAAFSLGSATLAMHNANGTPTASFTLELWSDASGAPGSALATFSGNASPSTEGLYSYSMTGGYALSSNSTYWLVASAPGQSSTAYFNWKMGNSNNETSSVGWVIGNLGLVSFTSTISFSAVGNEPLFSVSETSAIPEPSTYAALLGAAALGGVMLWRRREKRVE